MLFLNIILSRRIDIVSSNFSTLILIVIVLVCCFISLFGPLMYCIHDFKGLIRHDIWIVIDLILAILLIVISVLVTTSSNIHRAQNQKPLGWLMVISLSLAWARSLQIFRLFNQTRKFARVMTETIKASFSFIIILIFLMIAFANLMSLSERYNTGKQIHFDDFVAFWFDGYLIETGGLDPSKFSTLSSYIYIAISFIGAIVMINMLIAIMSDTWAYVSQSWMKFEYMEKLQMIITQGYFEYLCRKNRKSIKTFIVILKKKTFESKGEQAWDGQLAQIKRVIINESRGLREEIKQIKDQFQMFLKQNNAEQEGRKNSRLHSIN